MQQKNEGIELKCKKCRQIFIYKGKHKTTATCPDCRKINKIAEARIVRKR